MFDAVLVLGSGIKPSGELVESSKFMVKKAVELFKKEKVANLVFSGRWAWSLKYIPPLTEAEAMALYAQSLGCPQEKIFVENESVSTVSNLCLVKKKIFLKKGWKKLILIGNEPHQERVLLNVSKVLGRKFMVRLVLSGFRYPDKLMKELKEKEKRRFRRQEIFMRT